MSTAPAAVADLVQVPSAQLEQMKAQLAQYKAQGEENRRQMGLTPSAFYQNRADREEKIEIARHVYQYIRCVVHGDEAGYVKLQSEQPDWYKTHANFNEGTGAQGLFAVPDVWLDELFSVIEKWGFVRKLFRKQTLTSKNLLLTKLNAFTGSTFVAEGGAATLQDASAVLERSTVTAKLAKGAMLWTEELEEDAMASLMPGLTEQLGIDMAYAEDVVGIAGSTSGLGPTTLNDAFNGLLFQTFANIATMDAGKTGYANVSWTNLIDVSNTAVTSIDANSIFLMPRAVYVALRKEKDKNDRPIWSNERPMDGAGQTGLDAIIKNVRWAPDGTPAVVVPNKLWTASAAGKIAVVYGDFNYALLGERKAMTTKTFNEYYGSTSLSGQNKVLELSERIAYGFPDTDAFAVLKTAAS